MSTDPAPTGEPQSTAPGRRSRPPQPRKTSPAIAQLALRMQEEENLTYDQIATRLAVSRITVARLLAAAREMENPETGEEWTIPRSGAAPLQFRGTLKTKASSEFINTKPDTPNEHYWDIEVYQLANDPARYVVTIAYHKRLKGQVFDHYTADVTTDVSQALANYNPMTILAGFPPVPRFAVMQASLEKHCHRQWESLLTTILAEFPVRLDAPAPVGRIGNPAASRALDELGDAARPFVALQTPEAERLATAVRAVIGLIERPVLTGFDNE